MEQGILLKPVANTENVEEEEEEEEEEATEVLFEDEDMEYGSDENGGLTEMMTVALTKLGINEQQQGKRRSSGGRPSLTEDAVISSCTSSASAASAAVAVASERLPTRCLSTVSNKPHKAHDTAWEAIRAAAGASPDGSISLTHFKFVQRLGSGDIGSVYLAELRSGDADIHADGDSPCAGTGTGCFFAVKVMDKASLAKRNKLQRAKTEREILEMLDHPFLPTLYAHIDNGQHSCLVMEFCPGGDLHVLRQLQPGKRFTDDAVRFYAAEVLTALEYLHMMGVIYRDLKPENVLVREDGHIMLSDFDLSLKCSVSPTLSRVQGESSSASWASPPTAPGGSGGGICNGGHGTCMSPLGCVSPCTIHPIASCLPIPRVVPFSGRKIRRQRRTGASKRGLSGRSSGGVMPELLAEPTSARSMSFVGTHEYLAPEIILGEGHGSAVDWWTFGIFLYELLYSKTPFKGSDNEATLTNVVTQLLRFPTVAPAADEPLTLAAQLHQPHPTPTLTGLTPSIAAQDLIRCLLVKDPRKRLGAVKGATEIKQHAFFEGVNWALIRCATPPEIPSPFTMPGLRCSNGGGGVDADGHVCWVSDDNNSDNGGGGATPDFEFF